MKLRYCPNWYIENMINRSKLIHKVICIMMVFIIFVMFISFYMKYLKLLSVEKDVSQMVSANLSLSSSEKEENNPKCYRRYRKMEEFIRNNGLEVKELEIDDENMIVSFYIDNKYNYAEVLEKVKGVYSIIELSPLLEAGYKLYFTMKVREYV